ncbi:hypothetical protein [Actinomadura madurae]|uniref:Uncharacterized protein n=1 Tax=Actinomadura madurae TaxID=1993 RepID=A0A1I5F8B1_9ACTN|nr:hypothetical protein [Actinomadura madurae]SFO19541.1 hypothetical protein SAMN04489713_104458 [Actinomadura madurae]SPT60248.1 Uncharacterised protein [Actinomadura madurae]
MQSPGYRDDKVGTTLRLLPDLLARHRGPRLTVRAANVVVDGPQAVLVSNNPYQGGDPAGFGRRERLDSGGPRRPGDQRRERGEGICRATVAPRLVRSRCWTCGV